MSAIKLDPARLIASGLPYTRVYARLARGWDEERAYSPEEQLCPCGCRTVASVPVGARRYCMATARALLKTVKVPARREVVSGQVELFGWEQK